VKCAGPHDTASCRKSPDTPATCALCGGPHPAIYRGCEYYHRLYRSSCNNINNLTHQLTVINTNHAPLHSTTNPPSRWISYANVVKNNVGLPTNNQNNNNNEDISRILDKFLRGFKSMFNQLIQQNSMVLNMLSTLIGKING
jgi:hypothetical protein